MLKYFIIEPVLLILLVALVFIYVPVTIIGFCIKWLLETTAGYFDNRENSLGG